MKSEKAYLVNEKEESKDSILNNSEDLVSIINDDMPDNFDDKRSNISSVDLFPSNDFLGRSNDFENYYLFTNKHSFTDKNYFLDKNDLYSIEDFYSNEKQSNDEEKNNSLMSNKEAGETVESIIYDSVSSKEGSKELNIEEKRKFSNWLLNRSNRVLLDLYHNTNPMRNDDIEYS